MATLTGKLVSQTYKALLKMIDNDILTESEKQISDGFGQGTGIFIDDNGFIRASVFKVTGGSSSQFLKGDGTLDGTGYLPVGTTTSAIAEGSRLYFTQARVLNTILTGFVSTEGTVTAADSILSAINKLWWNIENGGGGGGGYVPYTGATQNVNLGTYGLIADFVQFNNTNSAIPTTAGTMAWNNTDGTIDLRLKGGNVTLQIGQENVVRVVNKTGANLTEAAYKVARVRNQSEGGAQGQRLAIVLAIADSKINHTGILGIVTENITNNQEGFVTTFGEVRKIDTTGDLQGETWLDGDVLWLSDSVAGQLTNIEPETHPVQIGYVVYAHANNGKIFVKLNEGVDELHELHDVTITDVEDEDVLFYDATEGYWINKNIYTAINATDVGKSLLGILNAEDTTPVTTKPRGIRINVDNSVSALDVGTQGYLPYYDDTDFYIDSPVFTDGDQVFIGGDDSYLSVNSKLTVVGGNLTVDDNWGIHLGLYQILFRYNATGELRIGTGVPNDFITFFANSLERARLSASGFLGLGVTNPASMIHAKATTAYPKIIIDNASPSGGGMFSARQDGTETALFGVSGAWLIDNSSDATMVATRAGQGIQFFTNGSNSQKMGINADGNVFVGQTPTYFAGATHLIVRGKTGAGFLGVQHFDMSIRGSINTFNSVFQVGTSTFHSVAVIVEDIERARFNSSGRFLLGTTSDNTVDIFQANGSLIATAIKKTGGTASQFLKADGSVDSTAYGTGSVTSVSATVPTGFAIAGSPITTSGTLAITFASGYSLPTTASQTTWDSAYTFTNAFPSQTGNAGKYLSTNGTALSWQAIVSGVSSFNSRTGAVTLVSSDVFNALGYTAYDGTANPNGFITISALSGYVPTSRTITINGTTQNLSANITFTTGGVTSFNTRDGAVTLTSTDVTTALGFTPVTQARTLTINGQGYDLSANRSWTITPSSGMRNVTHYTATANQTIFTITGGYTVGLIDIFLNGVRILESDFTATNGTTVVFNEGVKALDNVTAVLYTASATSGITGSGTVNYLAKWSGTSAITNSLIFDNGTNVGIGTATPSYKFVVNSATNGISAGISGSTFGLRFDNGGTFGFGGSTIHGVDSTLIGTYQIIALNGSQLILGTGGSEQMRILANGNLGLGTSTPVSYTNYRSIHISGATSTSSAILYLTNSTSSIRGLFYAEGNGNIVTIGTQSNHPFSIVSNDTERFRISSSGNTGIGNNSPDTSYNAGSWFNNAGLVVGNISTTSGIQINSSPTSTLSSIRFGDGDGANNLYDQGFINYNHNLNRLSFGANRSTAMIITSGARTLIGGTSDNGVGTLQVWHPTGGAGLLLRSGADLVIEPASGTANAGLYNDYGALSAFVGSSVGAYCNGTTWVNASDARLKKEINTIDLNALEIILKLNPVYYKFINDENQKQKIGFIAQEIINILPQVVDNSSGDYLGIDYGSITSILVKSTQEIIYKFETQAEKIARLETRVQQLEAK